MDCVALGSHYASRSRPAQVRKAVQRAVMRVVAGSPAGSWRRSSAGPLMVQADWPRHDMRDAVPLSLSHRESWSVGRGGVGGSRSGWAGRTGPEAGVIAEVAIRAGARGVELSKSVAKARIEPGRRERIVDILRFFSRPIRSRGAFATDLDTPPLRTVPGAPSASARPLAHRFAREEAQQTIRRGLPRTPGPPARSPAVPPRQGTHPGWCRSGLRNASSAQRNPPRLAPCGLSAT